MHILSLRHLTTFSNCPGNDDSWATSATTHTYFRHIQMWGSSAAPTVASTALPRSSELSGPLIAFAAVLVLHFLRDFHEY